MLIFYPEKHSDNITTCLSSPPPLLTGGCSPLLNINNWRGKKLWYKILIILSFTRFPPVDFKSDNCLKYWEKVICIGKAPVNFKQIYIL